VAGLVGAGRTELAEALFGIAPAVSGTILLDSRPLEIRSPRHAMRHGIFLIPEDRRRHGLVLEMALSHNITLPSARRFSRLGLIRGSEERRAAEAERQRLGIKAPSIEVAAATLSGGNQQKVVIAKGLLRAPSVLLFDEPTRGIDVGARAEIYALMRRLASRGAAIVMISSDMEEVLGTSDRIAVLHEGSLAGILPREAASEESILQLAVGGRTGSA
jgi:ribose transport system ATP-binding protein